MVVLLNCFFVFSFQYFIREDEKIFNRINDIEVYNISFHLGNNVQDIFLK